MKLNVKDIQSTKSQLVALDTNNRKSITTKKELDDVRSPIANVLIFNNMIATSELRRNIRTSLYYK
jgi:hypothetical protein